MKSSSFNDETADAFVVLVVDEISWRVYGRWQQSSEKMKTYRTYWIKLLTTRFSKVSKGTLEPQGRSFLIIFWLPVLKFIGVKMYSVGTK